LLTASASIAKVGAQKTVMDAINIAVTEGVARLINYLTCRV
jgi:hypothetical protein